MKIVFITPASNLRRSFPYRVGLRVYGSPDSITGPLILGHILAEAGHHVEVYEELYETPNYNEILVGADVICMCVMTSTALRAYELADRFRKQTHARIIMGGLHPTSRPEEALGHADQVITGEGEQVILDVVEGRITDPIVHGIPVEDLDTVPFPDYSLLKTTCKGADVLTTRGCPYGKCTFCTSSRMFAPYRERSVENVLAELAYYKQLGFEYMNFEDDNFTANKDRAKAICRGMIERGLVFKESFFFGRVDMADDEEMLGLLEQAHLRHTLIGVESLNPASLDEIDKGQRPADIEHCAQVLASHKIRVIVSLVLGIDTDTPQDIMESAAFASRTGAYQLQPAILTPFPGTPVRCQLEAENRMLTDRWSLYDMMNVTFLPEKMSPWELENLFYESVRSFYSLSSAVEIGRRFGFEFGFRRACLWALAGLGTSAARFASQTVPQSHYYALRHVYGYNASPAMKDEWSKYDSSSIDASARQHDRRVGLGILAITGANIAGTVALVKRHRAMHAI